MPRFHSKKWYKEEFEKLLEESDELFNRWFKESENNDELKCKVIDLEQELTSEQIKNKELRERLHLLGWELEEET